MDKRVANLFYTSKISENLLAVSSPFEDCLRLVDNDQPIELPSILLHALLSRIQQNTAQGFSVEDVVYAIAIKALLHCDEYAKVWHCALLNPDVAIEEPASWRGRMVCCQRHVLEDKPLSTSIQRLHRDAETMDFAVCDSREINCLIAYTNPDAELKLVGLPAGVCAAKSCARIVMWQHSRWSVSLYCSGFRDKLGFRAAVDALLFEEENWVAVPQSPNYLEDCTV